MMHPGIALALTSLALAILLPAHAQEKGEGPPVLKLWPDATPGAKGNKPADTPEIIVYLAPPEKATGAAVVICPGGGYGTLAMNHEGHDIAGWLNSFGVAGIICKYRVSPYRHPIPLTDAQRAIRTVRFEAKKWKLDPRRVGILGFSAGGHLASTAATHFNPELPVKADEIDKLSCRPDFAILVYPVITLEGKFSHGGSRKNLLGDSPDAKLLESLCNDRAVTKDTPPTFLTHTREDKGVPWQNSELFHKACEKVGVKSELHLFDKGRHGLGLGPPDLEFSQWPGRCRQWLDRMGLLKKP